MIGSPGFDTKEHHVSSSIQTTTTEVGTFTTWVRYVLVAVAWLFTVAVVVQIFLAGLSLFESSEYLTDHVDIGHMISPLAYLLPILALLGRVGRQRIGHAFVVAVLYLVQVILPTVDVGFIAALHPLNAFLLLGAAFDLGRSVLGLVRSRG
jgi:hypothetical protein